MSKIKFEEIDLSLIDMNEGQIEGLDRNPRQWTFDDVEKLKKSIIETPELLEVRGLIVIEYDFRYVTIGGNMRLTALRSLGVDKAPCIVLPKETPIEELQKITIKDNGSFGRWDVEKLKKDWEDCPFLDWGIDVFEFESVNEEQSKKSSESSGDGGAKLEEFKITLTSDEFDFVNCGLREICEDQSVAFLTVLGYYE